VVVEEERYRDGPRRTATVFLTGAECRFRCVFCDLWRYTLEGPTPPGAIPNQLAAAIAPIAPLAPLAPIGSIAPIGSVSPRPPGLEMRDQPDVEQIKLYNASNFFDERAVPESDDAALLALLEPFARVTVENHPAQLMTPSAWRRCQRYADAFGAGLEVAMGLESAHPDAARQLDKGSDLAVFERACERLQGLGVTIRAFVLVGAPLGAPAEREAWVVRSVEAALAAGASLVSLVPLRLDAANEDLLRRDDWRPATLGQVERAFHGGLELEPRYPSGAVQVDAWGVSRLEDEAICSECLARRRDRLLAASRAGIWPQGATLCANGCASLGGAP
jgi:hypothetical protein